jgi:hypothetical protein
MVVRIWWKGRRVDFMVAKSLAGGAFCVCVLGG